MLDEYYSIHSFENNRKEPRRKYMNWSQKKEVVAEINEVALYLLEFYYTKVGNNKYDFDDEVVARTLGWTKTKVRDNRLKLEKAHFFKKVIIKNSSAASYNTFLGHERWGDTSKRNIKAEEEQKQEDIDNSCEGSWLDTGKDT